MPKIVAPHHNRPLSRSDAWEPGDEQQPWSRSQLEQMDRAYAEALRREVSKKGDDREPPKR